MAQRNATAQGTAKLGKVFNDPIHGHMEMHPLLVLIIDTPHFQRLRYIKQLGAGYFVYPGASHNRFEHSLGVAHLAGRLVKRLRENQPELKISEKDVLCVQIAGLCHDLGHGPFSHIFDGKFMPEAAPEYKKKHEDMSLEMFDHLIQHEIPGRGTIEVVMKTKHEFEDEDFKFIKEMIQPFKPEECEGAWPFKGRGKEKAFLYDIVSNKMNGIDVDKMDYFARDCMHLGMQNSIDHERFIMFARVCDADGRLQICQRDKEVRNMYDLFYTRSLLHNRAYQHKVVNIIGTMIKDALLAADGKGGIILAETVTGRDMEAYTRLTDRILDKIMDSPHEDLQEAQRILRNIENRQLYHCLLDEKIEPCQLRNRDEERAERDALVEKIRRKVPDVRKEDFEINVITVDYGMKKEDPIEKCWFYVKPNPSDPSEEESSASGAEQERNTGYIAKRFKREEVSDLLPVNFNEKHVHVYYKGSRENYQNIIKKAKKELDDWAKAKKEHNTGCTPTRHFTTICGQDEA